MNRPEQPGPGPARTLKKMHVVGANRQEDRVAGLAPAVAADFGAIARSELSFRGPAPREGAAKRWRRKARALAEASYGLAAAAMAGAGVLLVWAGVGGPQVLGLDWAALAPSVLEMARCLLSLNGWAVLAMAGLTGVLPWLLRRSRGPWAPLAPAISGLAGLVLLVEVAAGLDLTPKGSHALVLGAPIAALLAVGAWFAGSAVARRPGARLG